MSKNKGLSVAAPLMAVATAIMPCAAWADSDYSVQVGAGASHDTNIFRLRGGTTAPEGLCRSDTTGHVQGQLTGDLADGPWRANAQASVDSDFYKCNSYLNNTGFDATVHVDRQELGPVGLNVDLSVNRRLSSFGDIRSFVQNIQNYATGTGRVTLAINPEFRVVGDTRYAAIVNDSDLLKPLNYRQYGGGLGVGWFSPLGNSLVLKASLNRTRGSNPRPGIVNDAVVDTRNDIRDRSIDLQLTYHPSVLSQLDVALSYIDRDDRSPLNADYHGFIGSLTLGFTPYDEWRVRTTIGRRLESQTYLFVDAVKNDYITFQLDKTFARFSLGVNAEAYVRRFQVDPLQPGGRGGVDRSIRFGATATARVYDRIDVRARVQRDVRNGSGAFVNYGATVGTLDLLYAFGTKR